MCRSSKSPAFNSDFSTLGGKEYIKMISKYPPYGREFPGVYIMESEYVCMFPLYTGTYIHTVIPYLHYIEMKYL